MGSTICVQADFEFSVDKNWPRFEDIKRVNNLNQNRRAGSKTTMVLYIDRTAVDFHELPFLAWISLCSRISLSGQTVALQAFSRFQMFDSQNSSTNWTPDQKTTSIADTITANDFSNGEVYL